MGKFNFNIDIDDTQNGSILKSLYNSKSQLAIYEEMQAIDLGLPSKTLWCKYNIDVDPFKLDTHKDWYGNMYSWGETDPKEEYTWKNYKWCSGDRYKLTKYSSSLIYSDMPDYLPDHIKTLELQDDVVYLKSHKIKKIPTYEQFEELKNNTELDFIFNYNNVSGLCGSVFTSKHNGNHIFFPVNRDYKEMYEYVGEYWTSRASLQDNAYKFQVGSWICGLSTDIRCKGYMIRGVINIYE